MIMQDRIMSSYFGLALGDALGGPTEFAAFSTLAPRFPDGIDLMGTPARVTDDTQMALAVGRALERWVDLHPPEMEVESTDSVGLLDLALREEYILWLKDPENTRAPGSTCLSSCRALQDQILRASPEHPLRLWDWISATALSSKGCGANMRVAPVAYLQLPLHQQAGLSQLQAAMTHGHPTALAASDITAYAISYLLRGGRPDHMMDALLQYVDAQASVYADKWLGPLASRAPYPSANGGFALSTYAFDGWEPWEPQKSKKETKPKKVPAAKWSPATAKWISAPEAPERGTEFIQKGWSEMRKCLENVADALGKPLDFTADPCLVGGGGWVAEEAFATALLCFLSYPDDGVMCIKRAAITSGDSDSIACIAGALAGAYLGMSAWPEEWVERIEYREELMRQAQYFGSFVEDPDGTTSIMQEEAPPAS